jgi:hypothetical protein
MLDFVMVLFPIGWMSAFIYKLYERTIFSSCLWPQKQNFLCTEVAIVFSGMEWLFFSACTMELLSEQTQFIFSTGAYMKERVLIKVCSECLRYIACLVRAIYIVKVSFLYKCLIIVSLSNHSSSRLLQRITNHWYRAIIVVICSKYLCIVHMALVLE